MYRVVVFSSYCLLHRCTQKDERTNENETWLDDWIVVCINSSLFSAQFLFTSCTDWKLPWECYNANLGHTTENICGIEECIHEVYFISSASNNRPSLKYTNGDDDNNDKDDDDDYDDDDEDPQHFNLKFSPCKLRHVHSSWSFADPLRKYFGPEVASTHSECSRHITFKWGNE